MCDLCVNDPTLVACERARLRQVAQALDDLALDYKALAAGTLAPHGDEAKTMRQDAHVLIQHLVAEWL